MVRLTVDITGLDHDLTVFEKQLAAEVAGEVKDIVTRVHEGILAKTPVDSGEAVASWRVSRDQPELVANGPVGPKTPGASSMPLGTEQNRAAAEAISRASREATDFSDPFRQFWVANAAPHIVDLELGEASKRAPLGMAAITAEAIQAGTR